MRTQYNMAILYRVCPACNWLISLDRVRGPFDPIPPAGRLVRNKRGPNAGAWHPPHASKPTQKGTHAPCFLIFFNFC